MQSKTISMELFDETLDINATENYDLAIQAGPDGLSFCLLDTLRNKMVMIRSHQPDDTKYLNSENIREFITRDDFLRRQYRKTRVVVPSARSTLVPAALYDPAKKNEYFYFNHKHESGESILANKLYDPDAFVLFALSRSLHEVLKEFYPDVHPISHLAPLFYHISHNRKESRDNYIHVHVERDYFNLVIYSGKELKLCNTFRYRNISDIMYFVLNVIDKLGVGQEETIFFSGQAEKFDDLSSGLSMYIRNIRFSEPAGNFTFSYVFNDIGLHRHINLITAFSCG